MTTYAVVYGTVSKMIRRVIADDDGLVTIGTMPDNVTPAVLCSHHGRPTSYNPLSAGESAIAVVMASAISASQPSDWVNAVKNKTGVTPPVLTCALIDQTNTVQGIIYADAAVDVAPDGFTMVQCYSPLISIGCVFDPIARLFTQPSFTIPPNAPGNRTAQPVVVPSAVIPNNTGTVV